MKKPEPIVTATYARYVLFILLGVYGKQGIDCILAFFP